MREFQETRWVRCNLCGESVPLCRADFAATGAGYWCWACSARETSPTLRQAKKPFQSRPTLKKLLRVSGDVFSGPGGFWQRIFLVWISLRLVVCVLKLLVAKSV